MFTAFKNSILGGIDSLKDLADRHATKETAEAVVAIATGVAHADGELEPQERAKITAIMTSHPMLAKFDNSVLMQKFNELVSQFSLDTDIGLDACAKELKDIGSRGPEEQRILVMRLGIAVAKSDGEIEEAERKFLARCCQILGVRTDAVGL